MDKMSIVIVGALVAVAAGAADFKHELKGDVKPWTSEAFLDDPQEFHFAIIGDRTGSERPGFFEMGMRSLNLLRPEFVMSVGDLVDGCGASEAKLRRQWDEAEGFIGKLKMPFFHVVGNHDIWTGFTGMTPARQTSIDLWKELHGTNTYYSFTYKGCLFLCLDVMERHDYFPPREPLPQHQLVRVPAMVSVADKPAERRMFECDNAEHCTLTLGAGAFEPGDNVFVKVKSDPSRTDVKQGEVQEWVVGF